MADTNLYTADFPWFFVVLIIFYAVKFLSKKDNINKSQIPSVKKIKRPVSANTYKETYRKADQKKTIESHKPNMATEKHGTPMHQDIYKGKNTLQYDYSDLEVANDSIENSVETLTDAISHGKYNSDNNEAVIKKSRTIILNKKTYSPKDLIILQTILDRKY